ncbi:MAG: NAD(P)H-dependent flavin oxidoreductase [Desulfosudaceae bacterium]
MIQTEITRRLNLKYPLIGGTMMSLSRADFVAAISNAGGLGVLASSIYKTREEFAAALEQSQSLTDKPFAVNINLYPGMNSIAPDVYLDAMIEAGVRIVETSGHSVSEDLSGKIQAAGMTWIHKCAGIRYARKARQLGADIITVVGQENGGTTGKMDTGTMVLVPAVVDAIDAPVIGGGGVSDGRGFLALLALGAQGVIMGTRLLATRECPIHDNLKQALLKADELDTMLVLRSIGASLRVWANTAARKCSELENEGGDLEEILDMVAGNKARQMHDNGDVEAGVISCGQGIGLVHDIPTVRELFDRIMTEAEQTGKSINVTA